MKRAVKLSLKFNTERKKRYISNLIREYRRVVNCYIDNIWNSNTSKLNKKTLTLVQNTRLSERYKSNALKQALNICISTKKAAKATKKTATKPKFNGNPILDSKFVNIALNTDISFDIVVRLSTLRKGKRINLVTKKTKPLNKWLSKQEAKMLRGCELSEKYITLWIDIPDQENKPGDILAVDQGINKLLTDNLGNKYGTEFKTIRDKIVKRKPGSKRRQKAFRERDNYLNRVINQLPWNQISVLGIEDLKNLKKGKKKNRSKNFRKAIAPWTYRQVTTRLQHKCQENRVLLVTVDPKYTSRTCPICNMEHKNNRQGEYFKCIFCGYENDADVVGALNIFDRTCLLLGSLESPICAKGL